MEARLSVKKGPNQSPEPMPLKRHGSSLTLGKSLRISVSVSMPTIRDIIVLHSAQRYIARIALENCIEYFLAVQCVGGNSTPVIPEGQHLLVFRRFLNAIESLNNIPDYLFHEEARRDCSLDEFRVKMITESPAIRRVSEIANAYKHRVRGSGKKKPFIPKAGAMNSKDIIYDHSVLCEAFTFWSKYSPKRNA
jgi:hypothetical protein